MNFIDELNLIVVDTELNIRRISQTLVELLNYQNYEVVGEKLDKILDKPLKDLNDVSSFVAFLKTKNGNLYKGYFKVDKLYDYYNQVRGYLIQFMEFNEVELNDDFIVFNTQNIKMKKLLERASLVAQHDVSVLISGETGTGKSKLAKWIHINSKRSRNKFVSVNCSAIPDTLFESEFFGYEKGAFTGAVSSKPGKVEIADGGTLFLDEVGDLSLTSQAKLLVFVDTKEFERLGANKAKKVDVRIISATNKDLIKEMEKGNFRNDLFYRICAVKIEIPPLRERKEDIPLIVNSILSKKGKRITTRAMQYIISKDWYGNVRELRAFLDAVCIFCNSDFIDLEDLSNEYVNFNHEKDDIEFSEEVLFNEQKRIIEALKRANGNKNKAAKLLGISPVTLWRKIKQYNIEL
ncbi:AAA family ATPase [Sulfurihydrogenibium azorense Az-Fu1]|jgi:transcriptional regulator with PAS, ATPase and Fis domain|uniref:AAA family ATPase n=1 Tax=Sulfurihydrogenibium azorense (strain DSM 15241 / OCM 825 / Az-Fu1) TaxID=204536 RepID=C1DXB1_SULAA|nr:sigma 54-interacting transcriptional regulator [Sulfurihydrogenibium azorense]ACN99606.1 AAA family ATPase [Sulfurihydrogenibium azorense Az-Fu1]MDM7274015.1 sigma 54-interacting transcriptional regulator [Sulfurihydrogenibium azorense]